MELPLNCNVQYYDAFLSKEIAQKAFEYLMNDPALTQNFSIKTPTGEIFEEQFGKIMFVSQSLFNEKVFSEIQWGKIKVWPKELLSIKNKVESLTGNRFETCVCIYYPNGNSGVDFHSDYVAFGDTSIIPSLSLGAERNFIFRENQSQKDYSITLAHGSLLIMGKHSQERYEHCLPLDPTCIKGRINITFRKYGFY